MTMDDSISELVTHDGRFHADEVFSSVVLGDLFPQAHLVRTRDPALVAPAPGRIVYDVGGMFDVERRVFDHHQQDAPLREGGVPFSSFGLVWQVFGERWLRQAARVPARDAGEVHGILDQSLVLRIDTGDNGIMMPGSGEHDVPAIIEAFGPDFDDAAQGAEGRAFAGALGLARTILANRARAEAARLRAARHVEAILAGHDGGPVLELPFGMPWQEAVRRAGAGHILFAMIPRKDEWTLTTMQAHPGTFENRLDLPAAWGGLEGEALVAASGVPDAVFVHRGLFFAVARSRDGILDMARKALEGSAAMPWTIATA